jgi:AmmeMemoRadiSam system protein B
MIREPAVAGQFYSSVPEALSSEVFRHMAEEVVPTGARAAVSPHAGLMYSGHVAGAVFSRLALPSTVILIGPNHRNVGPPISIFPEGLWLIPGQAADVDAELASTILDRYPDAQGDTTAHEHEHSLEMQIPFLLRARPDVRIVPILLGHVGDEEVYRELGQCLADIVKAVAHRDGPAAAPLLLASTDFSHYESDAATRTKDRLAVEAIQNLDPAALSAAVREHRIAMCGYGATMTVLHAVLALEARQSSLVRYATSGDITGDLSSVVGYAGLIIA